MSKRAIGQNLINNIINAEKARPVPMSDIRFLRPLAYWYEYMTVEQKQNLPVSVANALDSIHMILKGRL